MCLLTGKKVIVESKRLESQLQQKGFGERGKPGFTLDLFEALYLLKKKKISIKGMDGKKVSQRKLLETALGKEKEFHTRFTVFEDLRDNGFCTKTGFKFGFDFRAYPKGKKVGEAHSEKVIQVMAENEKKNMTQLARMSRLANSLKTGLVLAVVDSDNKITYYGLERLHPNYLDSKE